MTFLDKTMTRREAMRAGLVGSAGLYLAACGTSSSTAAANPVTLNWVTWNDHYADDQLKAVQASTQIGARVTLQSDDSDGYLKVKQTKGQFDIVSADALWVPKYHSDGLTESFDISAVKASSQLYSLARDFPFWKDGSKTMAYPFGWSTVQIYYNPALVSPAPDSWHVLADPKYKGKAVAESQPTDLMAMAGLATGAKQPYGMTTDEIAKAKQFLQACKPQFQKLVSQNSDSVKALADGSAWLAIENLGTDFRVKDAGGPLVKIAMPKEGVFGFIDGEQIVAASANKDRFPAFLDAMEQASFLAPNFIAQGRPLFNEKAYKLLVDQGQKERADLLLYNQPEQALKMTLKGPSSNEQAYIDAFNEVFGA